MRNVSDKDSTETKNTHFIFNSFFFVYFCLSDNVENYTINGQARDDNKTHELCMLDTSGYKHALRICNTY
jgi:hypothetical protein